MTYLKDVFGQNVQFFDKHFVGSDRVFKQLADFAESTTKTLTNYPPYNIKKIDENKYVIEMAVAGFGKQDIEIVLEDNKLTIKGKYETLDNLLKDGVDQTYLFKGISDRAFTRQFSIADNIEVKNADLLNGMLKIWLEAIIPEHKKPKKIEIKDSESSVKSFLTEDSK
jgi:molecular chaperone IbpA